jgi:hypothetical protein
MENENVVYIGKDIPYNHKKDEILSFVTTWMDPKESIHGVKDN